MKRIILAMMLLSLGIKASYARISEGRDQNPGAPVQADVPLTPEEMELVSRALHDDDTLDHRYINILRSCARGRVGENPAVIRGEAQARWQQLLDEQRQSAPAPES